MSNTLECSKGPSHWNLMTTLFGPSSQRPKMYLRFEGKTGPRKVHLVHLSPSKRGEGREFEAVFHDAFEGTIFTGHYSCETRKGTFTVEGILKATGPAPLMEVISVFSPHPNLQGPTVGRVRLWDNRTVIGSYGRITGDIDVVRSKSPTFFNIEPLRPSVERLLSDGKPFKTHTGTGDDSCVLVWTIEE